MNILYYDCFSGISGDMNLAAMIDLGVPAEYLRQELARLFLKDYSILISEEIRNGIKGIQVHIKTEADSYEHRNLNDILQLIHKSGLNENVCSGAERMFRTLAEAEAKVHGTSPDTIHFHELGAVDSILDIVGAAICFDYLKPDRIISSAVELGSGFAVGEHGTLPVPAPATVEILKNIPVKKGAQPFEATTPTGAVILACNVNEFTDNLSFRIQKTAYGIGNRQSAIPNLLRVLLGETLARPDQEHHSLIECNIDDMNPELIDYIMDKLFAEGADDVFITPIIMKKTRNASQLSVLCSNDKKEKLISLMLHETSTFGLRTCAVEKTALPREFISADTRYGNVTLKKAILPNGDSKFKPEYDEIAAIAKAHNKPIREVYREIINDLSQEK
jgi:hypothetical protein